MHGYDLILTLTAGLGAALFFGNITHRLRLKAAQPRNSCEAARSQYSSLGAPELSTDDGDLCMVGSSCA